MIDMRILVIDDEAHIRKTTTITLDALGHETAQAQNGAEALAHLQKGSFDAAFLDLRLGDESGLDLIPKLLALEPKLNIIVFTAYSSIDTAVDAMRRYPWPGNLRELRNVIERAVILAPGEKIDVNDFPDSLRGSQPTGAIIGNRVSLEELEREHIMRIIEIAGSMDEAAQILGIDPATLYRKRKRYAEMAEQQAALAAAATHS
jgi:DNA-binding NtrC family response regulator